MNSELIINLINSLRSKRAAFSTLLGSALSIFLVIRIFPVLRDIASSKRISDEIILLLLLICSTCSGFLASEGILFLFKKLFIRLDKASKNKQSKKKLLEDKRKKQNDLIQILPYLNYSQVCFLMKFIKQPIQEVHLSTRTTTSQDEKAAKSLTLLGIIDKFSAIDSNRVLYSIKEVYVPILSDFFSDLERMDTRLLRNILTLEKSDRALLGYFFYPSLKIISHAHDKYELTSLSDWEYCRIDKLIGKNILRDVGKHLSSSGQGFRVISINGEAILVLERLVFRKPLRCSAIRLDLDNVLWNKASGSGISSTGGGVPFS